jgi:hypothetical protein
MTEKVVWHAVKQYSRQVVILKLALIFDGLAPVSATGLAANWNRFNFYSDTFPSKLLKNTLAANNVFVKP